MNNYRQKATYNTPYILGSVTNGTLHIFGRCCPEDCVSYFHPLINWMKLFQLSESNSIQISIDLEYINTSSSLVILRILKEVKSMSKSKDVKILWFHDSEDSDMREVGKDLKYVLGDIVQIETKISKAS